MAARLGGDDACVYSACQGVAGKPVGGGAARALNRWRRQPPPYLDGVNTFFAWTADLSAVTRHAHDATHLAGRWDYRLCYSTAHVRVGVYAPATLQLLPWDLNPYAIAHTCHTRFLVLWFYPLPSAAHTLYLWFLMTGRPVRYATRGSATHCPLYRCLTVELLHCCIVVGGAPALCACCRAHATCLAFSNIAQQRRAHCPAAQRPPGGFYYLPHPFFLQPPHTTPCPTMPPPRGSHALPPFHAPRSHAHTCRRYCRRYTHHLPRAYLPVLQHSRAYGRGSYVCAGAAM